MVRCCILRRLRMIRILRTQTPKFFDVRHLGSPPGFGTVLALDEATRKPSAPPHHTAIIRRHQEPVSLAWILAEHQKTSPSAAAAQAPRGFPYLDPGGRACPGRRCCGYECGFFRRPSGRAIEHGERGGSNLSHGDHQRSDGASERRVLRAHRLLRAGDGVRAGGCDGRQWIRQEVFRFGSRLSSRDQNHAGVLRNGDRGRGRERGCGCSEQPQHGGEPVFGGGGPNSSNGEHQRSGATPERTV